MRRLLVVLALVLLPTAVADAAPRWSDGPLTNDIVNPNCTSVIFPPTYYEYEIGAYMGQYVDDASPVVGEVFDLHLVVATLGNNCSGTRPVLEIALPPGVKPATGSGSPGVRCYIRADSNQGFETVTAQQGCPSQLRPGTTNHTALGPWYSLDPEPGSPASPAWYLPQGAQIEIQVPVVSDRPMNGIGDPDGCVCAVASITTVNGASVPEPGFTWSSSSPQSGAYINLFVFPAKSGGDDGKIKDEGNDNGNDGDGDGGNARPRLKLPAKLRLSKKKAWVSLSGLRKGDRITVRAKLRGKLVARAGGTARASKLSLKLRPLRTRRAARSIELGGKATVVATVKRSDKTVAALRGRTKVR